MLVKNISGSVKRGMQEGHKKGIYLLKVIRNVRRESS